MTDTQNELKLAFTVDHRPVIDQWTDSVLDVIKDDLVFDSREEVKGVLLDFEKSVRRACSAELARAVAEERKGAVVTENTSDGYHTFKELYDFRKIYNAVLFNEWTSGRKYQIHKSKKHSDGEECFGGGWFIVIATLPTGQISNHYELKDWDLFRCEERELADKWDGHTSQDVLTRLSSLDKPVAKKE